MTDLKGKEYEIVWYKFYAINKQLSVIQNVYPVTKHKFHFSRMSSLWCCESKLHVHQVWRGALVTRWTKCYAVIGYPSEQAYLGQSGLHATSLYFTNLMLFSVPLFSIAAIHELTKTGTEVFCLSHRCPMWQPNTLSENLKERRHNIHRNSYVKPTPFSILL